MTLETLPVHITDRAHERTRINPELRLWFSSLWKIALGTWVTIASVVFFAALVFSSPGKVVETAGQIADAMGASNGLFSGVAVFLVGLSIHFQTTELRAQREQMELQREELALQREELKLTREEMTLARLEQHKTAEALRTQVRLSGIAADITATASIASAYIAATEEKNGHGSIFINSVSPGSKAHKASQYLGQLDEKRNALKACLEEFSNPNATKSSDVPSELLTETAGNT